jgi:hypothetical protein
MSHFHREEKIKMRKSITILALFFVGLLGAQRAKADSCTAANNLIQNCAFGALGGSFSGWSGSVLTDPNSGIDMGDPDSPVGTTPYPGDTYEAYLGTFGTTGTLSQTFATTLGATYTIDFALLNDGAPDPTHGYINSFAATFGATTLFSQLNMPVDGYVLYPPFTAVATGPSTTLTFTEENDLGYFELDSVSVVGPAAATPEPSSFLLLGSGILALAGAARRRFVR